MLSRYLLADEGRAHALGTLKKDRKEQMRQIIKNVVAAALCLSGIPFLVREWICRNRVGILMYHDVKPQVFERHLAYLSRHYKIILLDTLISAMHCQNFSQIPAKSVVITIDDGYAGNFALLPLVKKYQIRPTLYVCTQIINTHRHFWFKIAGQSRRYKERLKKMRNAERVLRLKRDANFEHEMEFTERQALNLTEFTQMATHVDFQPHTQFHPILPRCTRAECEKEILGSKQDLEQLLGIECSHFSYPNGNWTTRELEIVEMCGFRSARTTDVGWNTPQTDTYRLKVIPISDDATLRLFRAELTGIPQRLYRFFQRR